MPPRPAPALGLVAACTMLAAVGLIAIENADGTQRTTGFAGAAPTATGSRAATQHRSPRAAMTRSVQIDAAAPLAATASSAPSQARPSASGSPAVLAAPATGGASRSPQPAQSEQGLRGPANDGTDEYAHQVYWAINRARQAAHLPELAWSERLHGSALAHNRVMALANTLTHQVDGEPSLGSRESTVGVHWTFAAENIGWTTDRSLAGALDIEARMLAETAPNDAHRRNILSSRAEQLGVDVYYDPAHERLWLTEDFAGDG